jgi:hypothetical protein
VRATGDGDGARMQTTETTTGTEYAVRECVHKEVSGGAADVARGKQRIERNTRKQIPINLGD